MELKQKTDIQATIANPYAAPIAERSVAEVSGDPQDLVLPGHGRRIAAFVIDTVISYVLVFAMMALVGILLDLVSGDAAELLKGAMIVAGVGIPMAYHTLMEGSSLQASVGKLALGLRVVDSRSGERLSWWRAFLRAFVRGWLAMGWIFWLFVLLSSKRQGLWDMLASARVVVR